MANLQVKGVAAPLYEALRRRSEQEHRSISQQIVHIVERYLAEPLSTSTATETKLLPFRNSWLGCETAEELAKELREQRNLGDREQRLRDVLT